MTRSLSRASSKSGKGVENVKDRLPAAGCRVDLLGQRAESDLPLVEGHRQLDHVRKRPSNPPGATRSRCLLAQMVERLRESLAESEFSRYHSEQHGILVDGVSGHQIMLLPRSRQHEASAEASVPPPFELRGDAAEEGIYDEAFPSSPTALSQNAGRLLGRHPFPVWAVARHGVITIGYGDDSCPKRDVMLPQAVWIAFSVPGLVMVPDDCRASPEVGVALEQISSLVRMLLHDF